jgi:hypothetical protein
MRIPWMLLNVSDPSSRTVLDDKRTFKQLSRDMLRTTKTDGFVFYCALFEDRKLGDILLGNSSFEVKKYTWQTWENVEYVERLKESYKYIQEFFATIE